MNESRLQTTPGFGSAGTLATDRNRVLRNTYWLLALSMVPTVLGAWVGVSTGITAGLGSGMSAIIFLAGAFGFMFAIEKTKNSAAGVPVLLAFTFFMGLMLARMLAMVLGFKNGTSLVMTAFAGTAVVFIGMASLATVIKRDLSGMGKFLFVGALILLAAGIVNIFMQSTAMMMTLSVLAIVIFSGFILFDIKRVIDGGETNYISATLVDLPEHLQRVPEPAGHPGHCRRRTRLSSAAAKQKAPSGAFFHGVQTDIALRRPDAARSAALKHRHAFHMRRVRKHVHRAGRHTAVAGLVHQQAGITRQGGRVAADIDDALRRLPAGARGLVQIGQGLGQGKGTVARRVDQPLVGQALRHQVVGGQFEQVAGGERGLVGQAIACSVFTRPLHQGLAALDAQHRASARGQRQAEVAQAAEPVDHPLLRAGCQQAHAHGPPARC